MSSVTRRAFLLGAAASATALGVRSGEAYASNQSYDLGSASDNVQAFVKTIGDLGGGASWISAQGRIYAMRHREMPLPLLGVEGLRHVRFERIDARPRYRFFVRDWAFYKDLETGEVLDNFHNPLTGERNETRQILTGYYSWTIGPGGQEVPGYQGDAWLIDRPFLLPWTLDGGMVSVPLELLVRYANGSSGGEWMQLMTSWDALQDADCQSAPMRHAWTGDSGWMRWMEMGDAPGRTLWQSTGRKHRSLDDVPPSIVASANRYFPGSLSDPEGYEKTSYTLSPPDEVSQPADSRD